MVCRRLMLALHRAGHIVLPEKRRSGPNNAIQHRRVAEVDPCDTPMRVKELRQQIQGHKKGVQGERTGIFTSGIVCEAEFRGGPGSVSRGMPAGGGKFCGGLPVEAKCKKDGLDDHKRLQAHQEQSMPVLEKLKCWFTTRLGKGRRASAPPRARPGVWTFLVLDDLVSEP